MGRRRRARESALQILFEREFDNIEIEKLLDQYWKAKKASEQVKEFANWLVRGIVSCQVKVDKLIQETSKHWRLTRMAIVDRNILRLATFELLQGDMAPSIIINEAIEIAKKYSSNEAALFINGILDGVRKKLYPIQNAVKKVAREK